MASWNQHRPMNFRGPRPKNGLQGPARPFLPRSPFPRQPPPPGILPNPPPREDGHQGPAIGHGLPGPRLPGPHCMPKLTPPHFLPSAPSCSPAPRSGVPPSGFPSSSLGMGSHPGPAAGMLPTQTPASNMHASSMPVTAMAAASMLSPNIPAMNIPAPGDASAFEAEAVKESGGSGDAFGVSISCPWTEHEAPDGRIYYYNSSSKKSTWVKPEDLMTPGERWLLQCPWKKFHSDKGVEYYYNSTTGQSRWDKPRELEELEGMHAQVDTKELGAGSGGSGLTPGSFMASPSISTPEPAGIAPGLLQLPSAVGGPYPSPVAFPELTPPPVPTFPSIPSSAIEQAMKATLSSIQLPPPEATIDPPRVEPEPQVQQGKKEHEDEAEEEKPTLVFRSWKEAKPAFKALLREKDIPSYANWDFAMKLIVNDPQYKALRIFNEKKSAFNEYKAERAREEQEKKKRRAQQAKQTLEDFLLHEENMNSTVKYWKADRMYREMDVWMNVSDHDRREIFDDVIHVRIRKEKEEEKQRRKQNFKAFGELLKSMPEVTHQTTWAEAQRLLGKHPQFMGDTELRDMEKEDALTCFQVHIQNLEDFHAEDLAIEIRNLRRLQRKNREGFNVLLGELHSLGKLNSMSLWMDLSPIIMNDPRFDALLMQPGSNPLDLFKFYVENLKGRFHDEKKVVKRILKDCGMKVEVGTSLEEFLQVISADWRSKNLDSGNVKIAFFSLKEKAEAQERERLKEEASKLKRLEINFRSMLLKCLPNIRPETRWEDVRSRIEREPHFEAVVLESERIRLFKDYKQTLEEAFTHTTPKKKKSKKHKRRSRSWSTSAESEVTSPIQRQHHHRRRHLSKSRQHPSTQSLCSEGSDQSGTRVAFVEERRNRKAKKKKSKKMKRIAHSPSRRKASIGLVDYDDDDEEDEEERRMRSESPVAPSCRREKKKGPGSSEGESERELEKKRHRLLEELYESPQHG